MKRALVVDDDPYFRELLGRVLAPDFDVRLASDGESGLDALRGEGAPDVLLLDVWLPRTSSLAVLEGVRDDPRISSLPVVAFSAGRVEGGLKAALERHQNVTCVLDKVSSPRAFLDAALWAVAWPPALTREGEYV